MKDTAIVLTHLGMGDMIVISPAVRYFSSKYKQIFIPCKSRYYENCMQLYGDVANINILRLTSLADNNEYIERKEIFEFISSFQQEYDLHSCGIYKKNNFPFINLPDNFYSDLNLPLDTYNTHFKLHSKFFSKDKFLNIIENYEYAFVSGQTSLKDYTDEILSKINSEYLILSPSKNCYEVGDPRYEVAQSVINLPLFDYVPLIQNSKEVHVIGGVFSTLSKFILDDNIPKYVHNINGCGLSKNFFDKWQLLNY